MIYFKNGEGGWVRVALSSVRIRKEIQLILKKKPKQQPNILKRFCQYHPGQAF